ncbi:MAG: Smr/MutS family protein [Candidatus Moranbacteria bacterium]|nr:Smr/MutS family protein [Candidatus Moranbacteria bacterium]
MSSKVFKLDLHPIYNKGDLIDQELESAVEQAQEKKLKELEIICGKGSGQLKKRVLRFLDRKDIWEKYSRLKKDPGNSGRIFVYF